MHADRVDIGHPAAQAWLSRGTDASEGGETFEQFAAALAFFAEHPFPESEDDAVDDARMDFLVPALTGENTLDPGHPIAKVFLARCRKTPDASPEAVT